MSRLMALVSLLFASITIFTIPIYANGSKETESPALESSPEKIPHTWEEIWLGFDVTELFLYRRYQDGIETASTLPIISLLNPKEIILWDSQLTEKTHLYVIGGVSEISEVFMTTIDLILLSQTKKIRIILSEHVDPTFTPSEVNTMFEGYAIQVLPENYFVDFNGDKQNDMFFGVQSSATKGFTNYYAISFESIKDWETQEKATIVPRFLGYNIASDWQNYVSVSELLPSNYKLFPEYQPSYLLYPVALTQDGMFELRQAFKIINIGKDKIQSTLADGVLLLDWKYLNNKWTLLDSSVLLDTVSF